MLPCLASWPAAVLCRWSPTLVCLESLCPYPGRNKVWDRISKYVYYFHCSRPKWTTLTLHYMKRRKNNYQINNIKTLAVILPKVEGALAPMHMALITPICVNWWSLPCICLQLVIWQGHHLICLKMANCPDVEWMVTLWNRRARVYMWEWIH